MSESFQQQQDSQPQTLRELELSQALQLLEGLIDWQTVEDAWPSAP